MRAHRPAKQGARNSTRPKNFSGRGLRILVFVFLAFVLTHGLTGTVLETYSIPTESMEPTLRVGDYVLVEKIVFGAPVPGTNWRLPALRSLRRGDLVVFRPAHAPDLAFAKRVVALPGDTVRMHEKVLYVNDQIIAESYVQHDSIADHRASSMLWQRDHLAPGVLRDRYLPSRDNWGPIVVPPGRYFVLGDNREHSEDSRHWGLIRREAITGQPIFIVFSLSPDAPWWRRLLRPL